MSPTILGGVAALLLFASWVLRRRSPVLLRSTDVSAIAALNRAQIALLRPDSAALQGAEDAAEVALARQESPAAQAPLPSSDARQRARLRDRLQRQLSGDAAQRLQAMRAARAWGHGDALPVLRRGLRDVDPAVVLEAARGMERFRTCPLTHAQAAGAQRPLPRNVSRMR